MPRSPTDQVHEQLLQASIAAFNREGFHGTDSNRIAKAAGLAAGTFYRHFKDKRAAFLAAAQRFATDEAAAVHLALAGGNSKGLAERLIGTTGDLYRNWRVFRASLRLLAATDTRVRDAVKKQRAQILDVMAERNSGARERDALALIVLERASDAAAELPIDGARFSRDVVATLERLLA